MRLLFWNLCDRPLQAELAEAARIHDLDFIILAESPLPPAQLVKAINTSATGKTFHQPVGYSDRLQVFSVLRSDFLKPILEDLRYLSIYSVVPPAGLSFLLVTVHLPSKLHNSKEDLALLTTRFVAQIADAEQQVGHDRTIVVGDFNMNPFEDGLISSEGFHAVMARSIASKGGRKVYEVERPFFYNPMWGLLGDATPGPPGTFYHGHGITTVFWNMLDQVLIRPSLLPYFDGADLKVLSEIGGKSLLKASGTPGLSDHLPVVFSLEFVKELTQP